jgi:hypothetical protein
MSRFAVYKARKMKKKFGKEKNRRGKKTAERKREREPVKAVPHASGRMRARPEDQESGQIQPFETFAKERVKIQC